MRTFRAIALALLVAIASTISQAATKGTDVAIAAAAGYGALRLAPALVKAMRAGVRVTVDLAQGKRPHVRRKAPQGRMP